MDYESLLAKHPSKAFNPGISNASFRCGDIEAWGRGISKMVDNAIDSGILPPIFNADFSGLMVTFYNNTKNQLQVKGLDERAIKVAEYTLAKGNITNAEVQKVLNVSNPTGSRILSMLDK